MPIINNPSIISNKSGADAEDLLAYRISNIKNYTYENNEITSIKNYAFCEDANLTKVKCNNVTAIGMNAFSNCSALTSMSFPSVTTIESNAFRACLTLTSVSFPSVTSIGTSAFYNCTGLSSASFPLATRINTGAFINCSALTSITLGNTSQVCTLETTTAIPARASQHVTIYVPADLIESYKVATNWSTLYNNGYIEFIAITEE